MHPRPLSLHCATTVHPVGKEIYLHEYLSLCLIGAACLLYKINMSMGPDLIWPNITIGAHLIYEDILILKRVRNTLSSGRVTVQTKMY